MQADMQEKETVEVWKAGNSLYSGQAPISLQGPCHLGVLVACRVHSTGLCTSYRLASVRPYCGPYCWPWRPVRTPAGAPAGPPVLNQLRALALLDASGRSAVRFWKLHTQQQPIYCVSTPASMTFSRSAQGIEG